jgi:hypothetical protein
MRSWGVDNITGGTGTAVAEPLTSAGGGGPGGNARGVSCVAVVRDGRMDGCPKRSVVAASSEVPRLAAV